MPIYTLDPLGYTTAHGWRPLKKGYKGWDVFELQGKLNYCHNGNALALDGVFGAVTRASLESYQAQRFGLVVDGIAGAQTQVRLGQDACQRAPLAARVKGAMQKETSMLCGIYTPEYPNGFQDTGPLQRNTQYHPKLAENFDVAKSIPLYVGLIKSKHERYVNEGAIEKRAWEAAQGYWNSPVYADRYARGLDVPGSWLEYVAAVSIYA